MPKKCAVCGQEVKEGEGTYYARRLTHRICKPVAELQRFELQRH